jgi:hypothetical protein
MVALAAGTGGGFEERGIPRRKYTDFYRAASHDYQHEFAKIVKMGQSLAAETTELVQVPNRPSK